MTLPVNLSDSRPDMRTARRRWASGVAVVTTSNDDGYHGATVTSFGVASLDPPLVFLFIDPDGATVETIQETGRFAVSVLDRMHEFVSERFAGRAPLADHQLTGIPFTLTADGLPVLRDCLTWFDCSVEGAYSVGDHRLIIGRVETSMTSNDAGDPLLYYEGHYRGIA